MALRDIRLWLHEGTPAGARTVFEGDAFVSILGADGAAREALALLGDREAVTVFSGPDAMPGRLVAAVASGSVREAAAGCLPEHGKTPFSSVVVLGAPGAAHLEDAVRAAVASAGGVSFLDGMEPHGKAGGLPPAWTALADVAGGAPAWLARRPEARGEDCARACRAHLHGARRRCAGEARAGRHPDSGRKPLLAPRRNAEPHCAASRRHQAPRRCGRT